MPLTYEKLKPINMKNLSIYFSAIKYLLLALAFPMMISCEGTAEKSASLILWFDKPAQNWMQEALPVGNGYMGVMFFGQPEKEQLQFSEESLWTGGPGSGEKYNFGFRDGASEQLSAIRQFLNQGEMNKAHELASKWMTGIINPRQGNDFGDYGAQQTMGDVFVTTDNKGEIKNYRRMLNLETGIGSVNYTAGDVQHSRSFFGCYPQKVMVYRFENNAPNGTDYNVELNTPHQIDSITQHDNIIRYYGHLVDNALEFFTALILETDGVKEYKDGLMVVTNARFLTIRHIAVTGYGPKFPEYRSTDYLHKAEFILENIKDLNFNQLREIHLADYMPLFNRVSLRLHGPSHDSLPIDRRLENYSSGTADSGLEQLWFQYARYMMIASSRPGTMPMHLQGKWNNSTRPPWAADYHTNINLQMLYWPAEVLNLSECHTPLFDYMKQLQPPGELAASHFFGTRGWVVNTMNNAYGYTSPGWDLPWGFFPAGAAWLCRHSWEHFEYNRDTIFLKNIAWPLMYNAALFWMDYLTENPDGYLVSMPSYSPEHGGISSGASMDHQIAWDLFNNCAAAADILGYDNGEMFRSFRDRISPPLIGKWGQLQEWLEDVDDPDNKHRHVSHLYALHPGKQIGINNTPELANAALTSLEARGKDGTGWSLAWKINFYARLHKGEDAYQLLQRLLRLVGTETVNMHMGGTYRNLFCAHPPFQLDGNMGGAAGMAEMLMQSHEGFINILPAIPQQWEKGSVKGLKAVGGFEVDFSWENSRVTTMAIKGRPGTTGHFKAGGEIIPFAIPASGRVQVKNPGESG
jgi:alpha-L-fucosidase 2